MAAAARHYNAPGPSLRNYIFISIPKTGTTTLSELYLGFERGSMPVTVHGRDHQGYNVYQALANSSEYSLITPEQLANRFIFSFVRNPWDRVASLFYHRAHMHQCDHHFEKFVEKYQNASDFQVSPGDYKNQIDWLKDPDTGEIAVDFIGRFENYKEDVNYVINKITDGKMCYDNLPKSCGDTPANNRNPKTLLPIHKSRPHYREFYSSSSRDIIYEKCKEDIEYFDYEF